MVRDDLNRLAMRAVEMTILGRADPRLLVAARADLAKPKKVARILAALSNAAGSGAAVLLLGVDGRNVPGLETPPDSGWWAKLERGFPGAMPSLEWTELDIGGARIIAVFPASPTGELIAARTGGQVSIPWLDGAGVRNVRSDDLARVQTTPPPGVKAEVRSGWIEYTRVGRNEGEVDAFAGCIHLGLEAGPGRIEDTDCAGALILGTGMSPVELAVQLHPGEDYPGITRVDGGVDLSGFVGVRVYLAGAQRSDRPRPPATFGQLLVTIRAHSLAAPLVLDVLLRRDAEQSWRWVVDEPVRAPDPTEP